MRDSLWLSCYLVTGSAIFVRYVRESYTNAVDVCEMYPHFAFGETFREELWDHTTWVPIVYKPVGTLMLLLLYVLAYVAVYFNLVETVWLVVTEILSGKWIHHVLFGVLPGYLPFLYAEPGVPDLLSDGDDGDDDNEAAFKAEFGYDADTPPRPLVNATECHRALQKLVEVKLQHADTKIERPDDWLVFDPLEGLVVLQKKKSGERSIEANGVGEINQPETESPPKKPEAREDPAVETTQEKQSDAVALEKHRSTSEGLRKR